MLVVGMVQTSMGPPLFEKFEAYFFVWNPRYLPCVRGCSLLTHTVARSAWSQVTPPCLCTCSWTA